MAFPPSVRQILGALLPALSYGSREDFARLPTLAHFETLVAGVVERALAAGGPTEPLGNLREAARGFDAADDSERRRRLRALAGALTTLVELPDPLRALAAEAPRAAPVAPVPDSAAPAPTHPPGSAPAPNEAADASPAPAKATRRSSRSAQRSADAPTAAAATTAAAPTAGATPPRARARRRRPTAGDADPAASSAREDEADYQPIARRGPLADPIRFVSEVRGRLAAELKRRGIARVGDVLDYLPRTYEDRRQTVRIGDWPAGQRAVALATVDHVTEAQAGPRRVLKVLLSDATGRVEATFFNYRPWMRKLFPPGESFLVSGEMHLFGAKREIAHPEMEPARGLGADPASFRRIVPIYPGFERGEQRAFRTLALAVVERYTPRVVDPLPPAMVARLRLPALGAALREVHFPTDVAFAGLLEQRSPAQRRLAFDELFLLQLGLALRRAGVKRTPGIRFAVSEETLARARARLPFAPTRAQRRVLEEIAADMGRPEPMNRLLQGDVGSGKTAVATVAALVAVENGYQAALMAPTEILAEQHHRTLSAWLEPAGYRVALITAAMARKRKSAAKEAAASGEASIVVGTHALLQEDVAFARLGLAVIDEQHRFGVLQRAGLMAKGARPDVLVMTATPIPRTLAMAVYGDLDVSVIDELPPGRTPVVTRVFSEPQRERALLAVERELQQGRQAFVIYPLVEESEKLDLASATEGAQRLAARFPGFRVGLVHGRMKGDAKDAIMRAFRDGEYHVLVATTVVEVGVDVPNATVMVVESAERFGLAQLHQLRGRVGRGAARSYCFLIAAGPGGETAQARLALMEQTTDGFKVAEADLELRGPGEFLGTRQSGVPSLGLANLARDRDLLELARREAAALAESDPRLERPEHEPLRAALIDRWRGRLALGEVS